MPLSNGGDFTTTIFIAGTPFGMVCCQYMQIWENCHGGREEKKEEHRASDVLLKKPTEPCTEHLETLLVARRYPILHFTAPNVRDVPI